MKLQLALRLLLLTILQLCHLPPPLPPPVSNSSCLFTQCQPLYASCCTVLLNFSRYCTVRLKMFSLFLVSLFFMYYLCEKYYKPITVQYYIADCVSWVPRLTLLDLRTNWTYRLTLGTELVCMQGTYCTQMLTFPWGTWWGFLNCIFPSPHYRCRKLAFVFLRGVSYGISFWTPLGNSIDLQHRSVRS